jgi:hypothetical protein
MTKQDLLLLSMAAARNCQLTPVQLQKLVFLIQENVGDQLGGKAFEFVPYDYGPFDASIYNEVERLARAGLLRSYATPKGWKTHELTDAGAEKGNELLHAADFAAADYARKAAEFVTRQSFAGLVAAIYKAYPSMRANSVFRETK